MSDGTMDWLGPESARAPVPALDEQDRYVDRFLIGQGGMGEVRLVFDQRLNRTAVMKIVRLELIHTVAARRLQVEAMLTARLQHPGIVPVHDAGKLRDGRPFYVMREVRGRGLDDVIRSVHLASAEGWAPDADGWTFRRLIDALQRVAETVAYAHQQGVVHRDLKPANVLLESFGSVLVVDWGLARANGLPDILDTIAPLGDGLTRAGTVMGTPAYMPPEQAAGQPERVGPWSDVFALGATLYEILYGSPPGAVLSLLPEGAPVRPVPESLENLQLIARSLSTEERPTAAAFAAELAAWLDGARRREQALTQVEQADALLPEIEALRAEATALAAEAEERLNKLQRYDPVEARLEAWGMEDTARARREEAEARQEQWIQRLLGALQIDPDLMEAHARLAAYYRTLHVAAERQRDGAAARRAEVRLAAHDRGAHRAYLAGGGELAIEGVPPHLAIDVCVFREQGRRLAPIPAACRVLATGRWSVPHGSLLLRLSSADHQWNVPLWMPRGGLIGLHLRLPRVVDPDDCWVPGGSYRVGGDANSLDPLPSMSVYVPDFIIRRHPVTVREYLDFLEDRYAQDPDAALRHVPRHMEGTRGGMGDALFIPDAHGRFYPTTITEAPDTEADAPITRVNWFDALAYAQWYAARTGLPWRLPHELEWEKAGRGVDGRFLPWGDHMEPHWANMLDSQKGPPRCQPVHAYPEDVSVYGVRGLAGNVRDWCANPWLRGSAGPFPAQHTEVPPAYVSIRGGSYTSNRSLSRLCTRYASYPDRCFSVTGFRLCRDLVDSDFTTDLVAGYSRGS